MARANDRSIKIYRDAHPKKKKEVVESQSTMSMINGMEEDDIEPWRKEKRQMTIEEQKVELALIEQEVAEREAWEAEGEKNKEANAESKWIQLEIIKEYEEKYSQEDKLAREEKRRQRKL